MTDALLFLGACVIVMGVFAIGGIVCGALERHELAKYHRGWRP